MSEYNVPKVWEWENPTDSLSANNPTAGSRFDQELPRGDAPLQVYSLGTPNGIKVAIMLEELRDLNVNADYDLFKIHIGEGDQFGSDFVDINPNSKIPALVDYAFEPRIEIFESGSILLYLAEKYDAFLSEDLHQRTETLNWVFWQTGAGPYVGGGYGHFFAYAPEKLKYPIDRFTMETKRQLDLLDKTLEKRDYIAGDAYSIADMMIWPWYGRLILDDVYPDSAEFLNASEYPNLMEWTKRIQDRPAVQRALNLEYKEWK